MSEHILQIMPADGWCVAHVMPDPDERESPSLVLPLVGWALVEDGFGHRSVVGLSAEEGNVALVDEGELFLAYMPPGSDLDEWERRGAAKWRRLQQRDAEGAGR